MEFAPLIKELGRGQKGSRPLDQEQAATLFGAILDEQVPELELGAILIALRIKGEELAELSGFKTALDARCAHIAVPAGPRCVVLPTYNGARKQANLMPVIAFKLAESGIPVLIQGRHDFDSRVSPFELLAALGITAATNTAQAGKQLQEGKLACLQLESICPGLDRLLSLRPRLGLRNSGHTMAKLIDPAPGRSVRVVAVTHPEYLLRMEQFLAGENASALLMRGTEGEAYANPRRRPRLLGFHAGHPKELYDQQSVEAAPTEDGACDIAQNAATVRAMLDGTLPVPQPVLDQIAALKQLAER